MISNLKKIAQLTFFTAICSFVLPAQYAHATCGIIQPDYQVNLPIDLGFHKDAAVNTWWELGSLYEVDNPMHRYGFLLGLHFMNINCDNNSRLLIVKFLSDGLNSNKTQEVSIPVLRKPFSLAVPYSVALDGLNYFKQTSANTFSFSETILDKGNFVMLSLQGKNKSGLRKSGKNGIENYCEGYIPEVVYSRIELEGTLLQNGVSKKVKGTMLADRTWAGAGETRHCFYHYTWTYAQLENGVDVILYAFRNPEGEYTDKSFLNVNFPDGSTRYFAFNEFQIIESHPWISPVTNVTYMLERDIIIPSLGAKLHFKPLLNDFEIQDKITLYEGPSDVDGFFADKPVKGLGNLEIGNFTTQ